MERILTLAAYRQILREMQGVMGSTGYNNLYIMADTVRKAITDGKAYFLPQERGGIVIVDRGTVYVLYMCVDTKCPLMLEKLDRPQMTCLVCREGVQTAEQAAMEERLTESGMSFYQQQCEYSLGYLTEEQDRSGQELLSVLQGKGYHFALLDRDRVHQAYALLLESIDRYNVYGFEEMDWDALCKQDAFQVTDAQGNLCAVTVLPHGFAGGLSATAPAFRRQGLGRAVKYYGYYVGGKVRQHDHIWVADWNTTNMNILTSLGARDSRKRARQYVMPARTPAG